MSSTKIIRGVDEKFINTCDKLMSSPDNDAVIDFGSVDENNDIIAMITPKKFHHKRNCKTKFK